MKETKSWDVRTISLLEEKELTLHTEDLNVLVTGESPYQNVGCVIYQFTI